MDIGSAEYMYCEAHSMSMICPSQKLNHVELTSFESSAFCFRILNRYGDLRNLPKSNPAFVEFKTQDARRNKASACSARQHQRKAAACAPPLSQ
jgi:hypothetical protein